MNKFMQLQLCSHFQFPTARMFKKLKHKPKSGFEADQLCCLSPISPITQAQSGFKFSFSNAIKLEKVRLSHMLE